MAGGQDLRQRLQPIRQYADGIVHAADGRDGEDHHPGQALGAQAIAQHQGHHHQADGPAHHQQIGEEGQQVQAHVEDGIVIEDDGQQGRRAHADGGAQKADAEQGQDQFVRAQGADEQMTQVAGIQLFEEHQRHSQLGPEEHVPEQYRGDEQAGGLGQPGTLSHQELIDETPQDHLHRGPVDQLQHTGPGTAQQIGVAQHHGIDPVQGGGDA